MKASVEYADGRRDTIEYDEATGRLVRTQEPVRLRPSEPVRLRHPELPPRPPVNRAEAAPEPRFARERARPQARAGSELSCGVSGIQTFAPVEMVPHGWGADGLWLDGGAPYVTEIDALDELELAREMGLAPPRQRRRPRARNWRSRDWNRYVDVSL